MIEYKLSLASSGAVKTPGSMDALQLGYSRNSGVYRLRVSTADEWKGMTLRAFWHTPGGSPPASLVEDGVVEVPALVTAVPGEGCITFEGSDGVRTLTSADLRYRVAANETECQLGAPQIVVDRLGQRYHVYTLHAQQVCGLVRAVAAQNDQTVKACLFHRAQHFIQLGLLAVLDGLAHFLERLARRTENGAARSEERHV